MIAREARAGSDRVLDDARGEGWPFDSLRSLRAFSLGWPAMSEPGGVLGGKARRVEWLGGRDLNPDNVVQRRKGRSRW